MLGWISDDVIIDEAALEFDDEARQLMRRIWT